MKERLLPLLAVLTGITLISLTAISWYIFPRGPYYFVGFREVEYADGRIYGGEVAEYKEDLSGLDLPGWVRFHREHAWWLFLSPGLALVIGGFVSLVRRHENPRNGLTILAVAFAAGLVCVYAILSILDIVGLGRVVLAVGTGVIAWAAVKWLKTHPKPWPFDSDSGS